MNPAFTPHRRPNRTTALRSIALVALASIPIAAPLLTGRLEQIYTILAAIVVAAYIWHKEQNNKKIRCELERSQRTIEKFSEAIQVICCEEAER